MTNGIKKFETNDKITGQYIYTSKVVVVLKLLFNAIH